MRRRAKRKPRDRAFRFVVTDFALAVAAFAAVGMANAQSAPPAAEKPAEKQEAPVSGEASVLSDMVVTEDPLAAIANESTGSSIGFTKPILDTPRTVSFVSSEQIALLGISSVDDLTRAVPGTFTTTRYGLQGGINVRGVASDIYFRGMKRLNMQGHARTSLASMDSIEVIKGPPSPIYGMGKIGGYSNLTPKAGRAKMGAYLDETKGFVQLVGGDYKKSELSGGAGGPFSLFGKSSGFYVYGLLENSESFVKKVGAEQRLVQATLSVDDALGGFRLETGTQLQNSITSGAYMNRVTQALIDDGEYVRGNPLVNLDAGAPASTTDPTLVGAFDGAVGFRETHANSPINGRVGASNRPLFQAFNWPSFVDANGVTQYYEVGQFPAIAGIPVTMYNYLVTECGGTTGNTTGTRCPDPTGALRLQGPGGPLPTSGQVPIGFVLDPRTVSVAEVDYRGNGAYERVQDARLGLFFFDLVYDSDPDFTMKNQFFKDHLDSFKNSWLPYGEKQDIHVWENKFTVTRRIPDEILPEWLRVNSLASINYRETKSLLKSSGGDFDYRQDILFDDGTHYPNTIFWNQLDDPSFETGAPRSRHALSDFNEMGIGIMFDVDLIQKLNMVLGYRRDGSVAEATDFQRINENASTAFVRTDLPEVSTKSWDDGESWSASLSYKAPWGLRPYATLAVASTALDSSANQMAIATINAPGGHIGDAELEEFGLKATWLKDTVFFTVAKYKQTRTDISNASDPTVGAEVSSTETKGVETELKWSPTRNFSVQSYAVFQESEYLFAGSSNMEFTARQLGFQDVVDPTTGEVIYPAEAFLYGGRFQVVLPVPFREKYRKNVGNPENQYGLNINYNMDNGLGFLFGGNYFSSTFVDRTQFLKLPSAVVANGAVTYNKGKWQLKVNGYNLFDELYFRGRNSDTGTNLVSVMPGRRYEVTVKLDF